ncbi:hypothetical protein GCM10007112_24080 [Vulcanisaeta souniana JCM 11219]|uniref:Uncharacterized protein n=1 Tax=Vulcanisaeta souniana JCM 11219 TaxID=1293586 RepID=A0A830EAA9_9CREN|nr:hypothetical protein GCM10007112_24080 [Vulcanisaeta souniana JCM 11219]
MGPVIRTGMAWEFGKDWRDIVLELLLLAPVILILLTQLQPGLAQWLNQALASLLGHFRVVILHAPLA